MSNPTKAASKKKIPFNWAVFDAILQFNSTKVQAAIIMNLSIDTIERRIKEKYNLNFEDYKAQATQIIKLRLQQKAIQMAFEGNTSMMIFCLKNICGWKDKFEDERQEEAPQKPLIVNLNIPSNGRE